MVGFLKAWVDSSWGSHGRQPVWSVIIRNKEREQATCGCTLPASGTDCREACHLTPRHFRALKLLGGALYAMGDYSAAKVALEGALKINPRYPDALCDLGKYSLNPIPQTHWNRLH